MHLQSAETVVFFGTVFTEERWPGGRDGWLALVIPLPSSVFTVASRSAGLLGMICVR